MNNHAKSILVATIATFGLLGAAGCTSKTNEAAADAQENQADAVRQSAEQKADAIEDKADATRNAGR